MKRFLSFIRPINSETATALCMSANAAVNEGCKELHLFISSHGGAVEPAFAIHNHYRSLPIDVFTYNIGSISSAANVVFLSGSKRYANPNATFLFHQTSWGFGAGELQSAKIGEILSVLAAEDARSKSTIISFTSLSDVELSELMIHGHTKDAAFAKQKGIIHDILEAKLPAGEKIFQI